MERLFLRDKPVSILLAVEEMQPTYAAQVAKRIGSTFPHTCNILGEMEALGLLSSRPEGRIRCIELTDRGEEVAQSLRRLLDQLHGPDAGRLMLNRLEKIFQEVQREFYGVESESSVAKDRAVLLLGPLRRDLAKLMSRGDESLRRDAQELDEAIAAIAGCYGSNICCSYRNPDEV